MLMKKENLLPGTLGHSQMGFQRSCHPLKFKAECCGYVCSIFLWMEALAFIIRFLTPKVTAIGKLQVQREAMICQSHKTK